ncbi:MAG: hypothetical protein HYZ14_11955 [Bacteroidetes bacterium]|nr:hypothetical protein [Bacteroidota bacterium]
MKLIRLLTVFAAIFVLLSCKKEIYGCTDTQAANYSTLATSNDGSCFYDESDVKSTTVTISTWSQSGSDWATTIPYGEITADVIENGAVVCYINSGMENVWQALPLTIYQSTSYSSTIEVSITVGQVLIYWKNSDGTLPANPGERMFKITAIA